MRAARPAASRGTWQGPRGGGTRMLSLYPPAARKEGDTTVLATLKFPDHDPGVGYPLELKGGENKEQPFTLNVAMPVRLQTRSGALGGVGKLAAFASGEKVEYFLVASASVKGAAF